MKMSIVRSRMAFFWSVLILLGGVWSSLSAREARAASVNVFVGYADGIRGNPFYPNPWDGSPNTVFIGSGPPLDAGAVRIDNPSGSPVLIDDVTVTFCSGGVSLDLWGSFAIPAGFSAILTQTTQYNFDTSDLCVFRGCGDPAPSGTEPMPRVLITVGGVQSTFVDSAHVLDTGGFDLACIGNESLQWRLIGTTGIENPGTLTLAPAAATNPVGASHMLTATLIDSTGSPVSGTTLAFAVTAGPNTGASGTCGPATCQTDANGMVTFTYTGAGGVGTDSITVFVDTDGNGIPDTNELQAIAQKTWVGLVVTVKDTAGSAVAGADVVVIDSDGARFSAVSGIDGVALLTGLRDGSYTLYAWAPGYLPEVVQLTQVNGAGAATVTLRSGDLATTGLDSQRLTSEEIVAAGIDPDDPDNQNVFQFEIHLCFNETGTCGSLTGYIGDGDSGSHFIFPAAAGGSCTSDACSFSAGGGGGGGGSSGGSIAIGVPQVVEGQPSIFWLVIPGKASWLKEFFAVRTVVSNLASVPFSFTDGSASLELPAGLSLAPTSSPQSLTVPMADIPGRSSGAATWVIRGDVAGEYQLSTNYSGILFPFGRSVHFTAQTPHPLKVWGGNALEMIVDADAAAYRTFPYRVRVGLHNVTDADPAQATDVYNPAVQLLNEGRENFIWQPRQPMLFAADAIHPGDTFWTDDIILVPSISGVLDVAASFVMKTAGNVDVASHIESHTPIQDPGTAPTLVAGTGLLTWGAVPGAEKYQVFRTAAAAGADPFPTEDFPAMPIAEMTSTSAIITGAGGAQVWYAVSALIGGKNVMFHPILEAEDGLPGCGDGVLNGSEACDLGALNGTATSCCTSTCQLRPGTDVCRGAAQQCDAEETCAGSVDGACPADLPAPDNTLCNDGDGCPDTCSGGVCQPVSCPNIDAVVLAPKPLNVTIPTTKTEVAKTLMVTVRNADTSARVIGLSVDASDCPVGVAGAPDFVSSTPTVADTSILVPAGRTKTAKLPLTIRSADFTSFNSKAPARCTLVLTAAAVVAGGSNDPNPSNNVASVELNVIDRHDPEQTARHETVVKSPLPVVMNVSPGKTTKTLKATIGNADYKPSPENPGDAITLAASSSCTGLSLSPPVCTASPSSPTVTVRGGATKICKITATVNQAQISTPNKLSPRRCTVSLTATGPSNTETAPLDASNNATELMIDVLDHSDF